MYINTSHFVTFVEKKLCSDFVSVKRKTVLIFLG